MWVLVAQGLWIEWEEEEVCVAGAEKECPEQTRVGVDPGESCVEEIGGGGDFKGAIDPRERLKMVGFGQKQGVCV